MANYLNTAAQAVARSRGFGNQYYRVGYCANHVWNALTSGRFTFGIADADEAWARATKRHTDRLPPAGVPVYWAVGKYGHIALSVGGGRVRSTDYPRNLDLGECTLEQMENRWAGMTYRGWSEDFCGVLIPGVVIPKPTPTNAPNQKDTGITVRASHLRPGARNDAINKDVAQYNKRLWEVQGKDYQAKNAKRWNAESSSVFGAMTAQVTYDLYSYLHTKYPKDKRWANLPTHSAKDPAYPGPELLKYLGFKVI